jgi:general secretion pathway protein K
MKSTKIKREQGGFVVVVVLCMVIMLSVLLLGFNYESRSNLHTVDDFRKSQQSLNCAKAGLNIAIAAAKDTPDIHNDKSLLNLFSGEETFAVDEGKCSITISEESGKLNVNYLKDVNGNMDRTRIEQLLRLIDLLSQKEVGYSDIGYGFVPSIIDWTDSDDQVECLPFIKNDNLGAESSYYSQLKQPYRCRNKSLETTEELLLVKGITPQIFDRVHDYLTVYGDGKINVNCAPKLILESLSEDMDPTLAQLIIDRRKFKPFESIAELRDMPGMTDGLYQTINKVTTVKPTDQYYHVTSRGDVGSIGRTATAILRRNTETGNIGVVLYKEL